MKINLHIKNFQSITEADLEFDTGLNLIIGPSNSGKTAIFRAIKGLLTNPSGAKKYIRKGQKEASVKMKIEGYPEVTWNISEKGSPSYEINGEKYLKTGKTDVFELTNNNINFVLGDKGLLNLESEWDTMFPFSRTDTEMFKLFEDIFCISDSAKILQRLKEDEAQIDKEVTTLESDIKVGNSIVEVLEPFLYTFTRQKLINYKAMLELDVKELNNVKKDFTSTYDYVSKIVKLKNIKSKNFESNLKIIENYFNIDSDLTFLQSHSHILSYNPVKFTKPVDVLDEFTDLVLDIEKVKSKIPVLKYKSSKPSFDLSGISDYLELTKDFLSLEYLNESIDNELSLLMELREEQSNLTKEMSEIDICPLCGKLIGEDECQ